MKVQNEIESFLSNLDLHCKLLTQLGKDNMEVKPGFYMFDIYITGLLNRSVNIIKGFNSLMRDKNFIAAAPLVRIHLDSLLRLYAPQLINFNVDDFALQVYKGIPVRQIKDRSNKPLTDSYLVKKISELEEFNWVKNIYETGNGFVHFSDQTIFASITLGDGEGILNFTIGQHDAFVPIKEKHGAAFWMNKITDGIIFLIYCWIEQKKGYSKSDL